MTVLQSHLKLRELEEEMNDFLLKKYPDKEQNVYVPECEYPGRYYVLTKEDKEELGPEWADVTTIFTVNGIAYEAIVFYDVYPDDRYSEGS